MSSRTIPGAIRKGDLIMTIGILCVAAAAAVMGLVKFINMFL